MNTTIVMAILATAFIGLPASAQTLGRSDNEAAIKKIALEGIESFNRHEAPAASSFTAEADFVNVYGMWRKGSPEIEARQQERMDTALKEAKLTLIELRVRFLKPDVALLHELHEMSGMLTPDGETMPPHKELGIRVLVKQHGKWLITAFHNTMVRPVEPAARAK